MDPKDQNSETDLLVCFVVSITGSILRVSKILNLRHLDSHTKINKPSLINTLQIECFIFTFLIVENRIEYSLALYNSDISNDEYKRCVSLKP